MTSAGGQAPGAQLLGRYEFVRHIADGGMGSVFEARDLALDRPVALKRVTFGGRPEVEAGQTHARTMREARLAAQLGGHRNVVAVHDVQLVEGDVWLVLEYMPSRSLADIVERGGTVELGEAARIGSGIAAALAAAHDRGITHRDVKPGNVLLSLDGREVKLTDFGISHAEGERPVTSIDAVSGTPAYMAPEVARGDPETTASDVFSLGATLYRIVEGTPPFGEDPNVRKMLMRVARESVRPPQRSGQFGALLMALLADDPQVRPDAGGASRLLDAFARRLRQPTVPPSPSPGPWHPGTPGTTGTAGSPRSPGDGARPPSAPPSAPPPGPPSGPPLAPPTSAGGAPGPARGRLRRWIGLAAAAAVVVLALVAGLVVALTRPDPTAIPEIPATVDALTVTGDFKAADPCALFDTRVMARFGPGRVGAGTDIGQCRLTTETPDPAARSYTEAHYGTVDSEGADDIASTRDLGGVRLADPRPTRFGCSSAVRFADRSFVRIDTDRVDGSTGPESCPINAAALAVAVRDLVADGVTYRPGWLAGVTTAGRSACDVSAGVPALLVPGIDPQRAGWPNGSVCFAGTFTAGVPYLEVLLGLEPVGDMSTYGTASTVDGKALYLRDDLTPAVAGNASVCRAVVVHRANYDGGVSFPTEYVSVRLEGAAPSEVRCQQATAVALAVERNL